MIRIQLYKTLLSASGKMALEVELNICEGTFIALSGPSGSGKTTLLRMIAGLAQPESGRIVFNEQTWLDTITKKNLPPRKRNVGLVFQDYALFPNMTVRKNLEYGLGSSQPKEIIGELIQIMELEELIDRLPETLSGGQQQRVALARALVRKPRILLLDEPLSALDPAMRTKLQDYILKVHQTFRLTTILVSHDVGEILKMADRVIMLEQGKITRSGPPNEIFFSSTIGGRFKLAGRVVSISKNDVVYIVSVLVDSNLVQVIASAADVRELEPGDKVVLVSKAFNPMILKQK